MRFCQLLLLVFVSSTVGVLAQECGRQAAGAICPNNQCCNLGGFCGFSVDHCYTHCQSNCHLPNDISGLITREMFEKMFPHRSDTDFCEGSFYTYDAFIEAASIFGGFATTGYDEYYDNRKREIAAFLAQTAYATAGGPQNAPDPLSWGYCHIDEQNATLDAYCIEDTVNFPCVDGQRYYGRGPMQLRYNTYYGPAGLDLGFPLIVYPYHLSSDPVLSFKSALWYWMNYHLQKPSCHAVMTNQWVPNSDDDQAGRVAGFGLTTNIINGEVECGHIDDAQAQKRIDLYLAFCEIIEVTPGTDPLDCETQKPYNDLAVMKIISQVKK